VPPRAGGGRALVHLIQTAQFLRTRIALHGAFRTRRHLRPSRRVYRPIGREDLGCRKGFVCSGGPSLNSESVRNVIWGARIASPIIAAAMLTLWITRKHRRIDGRVSRSSIVGCAVGALVVSPIASFLGLVMGGYLGAGLGEAWVGGAPGATAGLAIGIVGVAAGLITSGGLAGYAVERWLSRMVSHRGGRVDRPS
jgi:hypothetical protein